MVEIEKIEVDVGGQGHFTNCYLVFDENKEAILIDPGFDENKIIQYIKNLECRVKYIIITHAHADHIGALENLQKFTDAKIIVHKNDYNSLIGEEENYSDMLGIKKQKLNTNDIIKVGDGYKFKVGKLNLEIIHTPGHTSGGICIFEKTSQKLFTGDTIFAEGYGRCDLYTGNFEKMLESIKKIFERFEEEVEIYPGHERKAKIFFVKRFLRILLATKGIIDIF